MLLLREWTTTAVSRVTAGADGQSRFWRPKPVVVAQALALTAMGVFMAAISAFNTDQHPFMNRLIYWLAAMLGGGVIAAGVERWATGRCSGRPKLFVLMVFTGMTVLITAWVGLIPLLVFGQRHSWAWLVTEWFILTPSVAVVNIAVIGMAWLLRRAFRSPSATSGRPKPMADDLPPPVLRAKLPPRLARSRLIAASAEDHYLRVRTEAGEALVLMRMGDALKALADCDGVQTHRSWWVSRWAVQSVRWQAGRGELTLIDGALAPVSRSHAGDLKGLDWAAPQDGDLTPPAPSPTQ